jgi:UDP-N-acetylglucosamine transferase subunit ALG13
MEFLTMIVLNNDQQDKLIEQYVDLVVDSMDMDSLLQYAKDGITEYIVTLTKEELKEEVDNYDEDLFDELVDNVTNETVLDTNNTGGKF